MTDNVTQRYRVNVKSLTRDSSIGPDGAFTQKAVFHVRPLDNGTEFDLERLVGGETLRRCQLLQERTHTVVEFAIMRPDTRPSNWQEVIVDVALAEVAKDSQA